MLVAEVVETYLREETGRLAQSTRRSEAISGAHITRLIGQVPIADLTPRMVRDFHRALAKTPRTANLALGFSRRRAEFDIVVLLAGAALVGIMIGLLGAAASLGGAW